MRLSLTEAEQLVTAALATSGAAPEMAKRTAAALVAAEAAGQAGHGLSRVAQ
jgi:(2R)-3-sulfolactate dehydrogenase (NADP+)